MKKQLLFILFVLLMVSFSQAQSSAISKALISPNPVEDEAVLVFDEPLAENVTVEIKDLTGKTVYMLCPEIILNETAHVPLNIESLRKGIYILQITERSGKTKTLRFHKT